MKRIWWLFRCVMLYACSASVLLDLSFRAKVGDFGLGRAIGAVAKSNIYQSQTARIVGTSGYIAPEYYEESSLLN